LNAVAEQESEEAQQESEEAQQESEEAQQESEEAQQESEEAQQESEEAQQESEEAQQESEEAQQESDEAQQESDEAQQEPEGATWQSGTEGVTWQSGTEGVTWQSGTEGSVGIAVPYLTLMLEGGRWSAPRPGHFTPGKETQYPLYRTFSGPWGWPGWAQKISPLLGYQSGPSSLKRVTIPAVPWSPPSTCIDLVKYSLFYGNVRHM